MNWPWVCVVGVRIGYGRACYVTVVQSVFSGAKIRLQSRKRKAKANAASRDHGQLWSPTSSNQGQRNGSRPERFRPRAKECKALGTRCDEAKQVVAGDARTGSQRA